MTRSKARFRFAGSLLAPTIALIAACSDGATPTELPRVADTAGIQPYVLRFVERALADVEAAPHDAQTWKRLGVTYLVNFIDLAAPCLEEAVRLDPRDAHAWYHLGRARDELGEVEAAVVAVEHAVELEPEAAHLHWNHGFWLLECGRTEEAQQAFERAEQLAPGSPAARVGAGRAALQAGDAGAAARLLEDALQGLQVNQDYVRSQLATAYRQLGRAQDANALGLSEAVKHPVWDDPWIVAANEYRALKSWVLHDSKLAVSDGRTEWAIERLSGLSEVEPDDPSVRLALSRALYRAGRADAALHELEEANRLGDDSYELHVNMVGAYLAAGRTPEALEHARRAVQLQPDMAVAHLSHARVAFESQELEEAVAAFRRASELGELDPRARVLLGDALCGLSRWNEAVDTFAPLTRSELQSPRAWLGLARAHAELGQTDEAVAALERVRELAPATPGIEFVARRIVEVGRR